MTLVSFHKKGPREFESRDPYDLKGEEHNEFRWKNFKKIDLK